MIEYRSFRNTDPPQLAEIWRGHTSRGLMQPMSMAVLERYVLAKPTFDPAGLIVAAEGNRLLGFAHAGFGPTDDFETVSAERGFTGLVMLRADADPAIGSALLARSEAYLAERGAKTFFGGASYPLTPFYCGLYGGSQFSGVLDSDQRLHTVFQTANYRQVNRSVVLQRDLMGFRPVVDRQQIQIRRTTRLETVVDPPAGSWWEAVMFEPFERTRWALVEREGGPSLASVHVWNLETMLGTWGVHAVGIVDLQVTSERRRRGLATNLLGEAFRQLQSHGVTLAEVHVPQANEPALAVFGNLGFEQVDGSALYCKD
ncbi:MAG: GNAT family N-acetyltransferase [Planctomycetota bacterium]|nr:MAG: GNAT family N-acetyltransferase [Planctomycetota bacterium]